MKKSHLWSKILLIVFVLLAISLSVVHANSSVSTTRVIVVSGNLAFGSVQVGSTGAATMTISNTGDSALTVSGISYPTGFTGDWSGGTIAAASSQPVIVTFAPTAATSYSGTVTVTANQTSGTNIISVSGTGSATPVENWTGFAHTPIGGGYTTVFLVENLGASASNATLRMYRYDGAPLNARLMTGTIDAIGPEVPLNIQAGGMQLVTARAPGASDPTISAWARIRGTGGVLSGVATFLYEPAGRLQTTAGVLDGYVTRVATIPVDDDVAGARHTGYAVANPYSTATTIRALLVPQAGVSGQRITLNSITLGPGEQKATFVFQDPLAPKKFLGTLVLIAEGDGAFVVVALVQNQGLFTAVPVRPTKATGIN